MNDLAGWLLQQIAADERGANDAADYGGCCAGCMCGCDASTARVLAECEAKRRIVERFQETARPYADARQQEIHETIEDEVLPFLAAPYADRDGYRDEWRPVAVAS